MAASDRKASASRKWRAAHPEAQALASARWRSSNPAQIRLGMLINNSRIRAKAKGIPFSLTKEDIVIPEVCPILGIPFSYPPAGHRGPWDYSPSLDRIEPSLGYVSGNINVISFRANRLRNDATLAELELILTYVRSIHGGQR